MIPIEELIKQTGSIFKLAILASKRTAELNDGFKPKIEDVRNKKIAMIALEEIASGKVEFTIDKKKVA